jgi:hypothetical protein
VFARGRVGAPYPQHAGLPPIHLQKLSCTACHSGPQPEATTRRVKTSLAHRLGGQGVNKADAALPHLFYPVFARQDDGTTTPNRLMWPAFWGRMVAGTLTPIAPTRVKAVMARAGVELTRAADGSWSTLENATLARILRLLAAEPEAVGIPAYVAGGKLYRLDTAGNAAAEDHPSAQPYLWQMAHDVRPASLALGARSCQECHDETAPIFFGQVTVDSPLASGRGESWPMSRFQKNLDTAHVAAFARSFRYRPWLKGTVTASTAALLLVLLAFVTPAIGRLSAATRTAKWMRLAANAAGLVSCGVSVVTGLPALISGEPLTGRTLVLHVGSAPVFVASAVIVAIFWAHRNRFAGAPSRGATPYIVLIRKVSFWVALAAAIPAVASATLAMFPVFASVQQAALFRVHRYAAATLATAAVAFVVFALIAWLRRDVDDQDAGPRTSPGA